MKVYFIGIGGIGVSALARFYMAKNWQVFGSDLMASEITQNLEKEGVVFFVGHKPEHITADIDKIIYSAAVKNGNPELVRARGLDIPTLSYAEALGELTKQYLTIAVSGSHGKSTTTALLALMLIKGGLDPTVIIGTRLKEFGGANFRFGKSRYLVIEADEWNNSFQHYHPTIVALTNIDKEHLDTFKNLRGVVRAFGKYLNNVANEGKVIINAKDRNSLNAVKKSRAGVILYNRKTRNIKWPLKIPGVFNQLNAEAAWQAAHCLGVSKKDAQIAVKKFAGSWRRMELLKPKPDTPVRKRATYIDDYAHHPSEIKAVGEAIKTSPLAGGPKKRIAVIFQPHQIERLTNLFNDFVDSFDSFDVVGILPTYEVAGRELIGIKKTSQDLVRAINKKNPASAFNLKTFKETFNLIKDSSVIVFMGAGDIDVKVRKYFDSKLFKA